MQVSKGVHYIAFSGTKLSLTIIESILPSIGKSDQSKIVRKPEDIQSAYLFTDELVKEFISLHLDWKSVEAYINKPELMSMLRGRKRITALFLFKLGTMMQSNPPTETYEKIFTACVNEAYNEIVKNLAEILILRAEFNVSKYYIDLT